MFLIAEPFVSDYLKQTLQETKTPVVQTAYAQAILSGYQINFVAEEQAVLAFEEDPDCRFFTNSENALDWLFQKFPSSELVATVTKLKDKIRFREILSALHPDYFYRSNKFSALYKINPEQLPFPVILKPSVGFFSLGVQSIKNQSQWYKTLLALENLTQSYAGIYPTGVLDNSVFVIEEVIPGEEVAIDCYYDAQGAVVVLNLMQHLFASGEDVNDRVYISSSAIMEKYLTQVEVYLNQLGELFHLKDFQAHIELRIQGTEIAAIEINPLRFGGWCSTADLAQYSWGMNIYTALAIQETPDWDLLMKRDPDHVYALVVLNNSTGEPGKNISHFDYEALLETIAEPLELRKTDYRLFPLFGFLMCRVPAGNLTQLEKLLHSDLQEFITAPYSG